MQNVAGWNDINAPIGAQHVPRNRHRLPNLVKKLNGAQLQPDRPAVSAIAPIREGRFSLKSIVVFCLAAAVLIVLAHVGLRALGSNLANGAHTTDQSIHQVAIGADVVALPANMIRYPSFRRSYQTDQIGLFIHWPSFEGYTQATKAKFDATTVATDIVFIKLQSRFSEHDMAARIKPIYSKFMGKGVEDKRYRVQRYRLDQNAGFFNEDLVTAKLANRTMAARCMRAGNAVGQSYCLSDINVGRGLSLTYRFHSSLLGNWKAIEDTIRAQFGKMIR